MPTTTRTFRVFVSSTFEDLKEERDALQREVFPALAKLCQEHGARFQAIDLRWGVREEASLDQKTMEICLAEIERCQRTKVKPNFIVLLGDRYGWRPAPARIEAVEFERVRSAISDKEALGLVDVWYQRDDNAVPPEYLLRPRTGEFVEAGRWHPVEQRLWDVLQTAARAAGLAPADLFKYEASATHQEILKGLGESLEDRQHVFAFFRGGIERGDGDVRELKRYLKAQLGDNVFSFDDRDLDELCKRVRESIEKVVISEAQRFESRPALDLEIEAHDAFAKERSRHFVGRKRILDAINEYLKGKERRPLVIQGASGSGKSAVLAQASGVAGLNGAVRRFIGATPESSSEITLLRSLCLEIARRYGQPEEAPATFNELAAAFADRLKLATREQPLILFIDALDQLGTDHPATPMRWLPRELPPNCKVIVSTTELPAAIDQACVQQVETFPVEEADEALGLWLEKANRTLQPEQREKLLVSFRRSPLPLYLKLAFEEARRWRWFDPPERCVLGERLAGIVDQFLARLAEESNHGPTLVNHALGYLTAARYGLTEDEILVVLSKDEEVWHDFKERAKHEPAEKRLPVIVWSRLYLDMEPYLTERSVPGGTVIAFYHRQMAERASTRYLAEGLGQSRHTTLASYYAAQPAWLDSESTVPNGRKVAEEPFQQLCAGLLETMKDLLTDLQFVAAKFAAGLKYDLLADYQTMLASSKFPSEKRTPVVEFLRFVRSQAHILTRYPNMVVQRALFEPEASWPTKQARKELSVPTHKRMWVEWLNKPEYHAPCVLTIPSFCRTVETEHWLGRLSFSPDGNLLLWGAQDGSLRVWQVDTGFERVVCQRHPVLVRSCVFWPTGASILSSWDDGAVVLQSLEGGQPLWSFTLEEPAKKGLCAVSPDRRKIALTRGNVASIWDTVSLKKLVDLPTHFGEVSACEFSPDAKVVLLCGGEFGKGCWMQLADSDSGKRLGSLAFRNLYICDARFSADGKKVALSCGVGYGGDSGNLFIVNVASALNPGVVGALAHSETEFSEMGEVTAGAFTKDGSMVVCSCRNKLLICDGINVSRLAEFQGYERLVDCAISPDANYLASGSLDGEIRVWSLQVGLKQKEQMFHTDAVTSCDFSPNSDFLITGSDDGSLKIWDAHTFDERSTIEGDTPNPVWCEGSSDGGLPAGWIRSDSPPAVLACAVSPDGTRIAAGYATGFSARGSLRVIDLEHPEHRVLLLEHTGDVNSCAFSPDSRLVASASDDKSIKVCDTIIGRKLTLCGHTDEVNTCAFSPDGCLIASGGKDRTVRLWQVRRRKELAVFKGHQGEVKICRFSPSGKLLLSSSEDHTLRLWDLDRKELLMILKGHEGSVTGCDFSPNDGMWIASVGGDDTVRIWEGNTGKEKLSVWMEGATTIKWRPDGDAIVIGDKLGKLYFLSLRRSVAENVAGAIPIGHQRAGDGSNLSYKSERSSPWQVGSPVRERKVPLEHQRQGVDAELTDTWDNCAGEYSIPGRSVDTPLVNAQLVDEGERQMKLNLEYQAKVDEYIRALAEWRELPFLQRLRTPRPKKPVMPVGPLGHSP